MEFRVLGPLEVLADGSTFVPNAPKVRALLAILLLRANELVSAERLIEDLWSGTRGQRWEGPADIHLAAPRDSWRRAIVTRSPGYLLRVDEDELDLARFERLRAAGKPNEALALWRRGAACRLRVRAVGATGDRDARGETPRHARGALRARARLGPARVRRR